MVIDLHEPSGQPPATCPHQSYPGRDGADGAPVFGGRKQPPGQQSRDCDQRGSEEVLVGDQMNILRVGKRILQMQSQGKSGEYLKQRSGTDGHLLDLAAAYPQQQCALEGPHRGRVVSVESKRDCDRGEDHCQARVGNGQLPVLRAKSARDDGGKAIEKSQPQRAD